MGIVSRTIGRETGRDDHTHRRKWLAYDSNVWFLYGPDLRTATLSNNSLMQMNLR